MKNKNTIIKTLFVFITLGWFLYANAADINLSIKEIQKEWDNAVKVSFDTTLPENWLTWEMKIFKDIKVNNLSKDNTINNKINVVLDKEIKIWSTYNIFSVFWVDWSADFIVEDNLNAKIISQAPDSQGIIKIVIKDKKNIEVEFKNPLIWNDFEFKLLEDLSVSEISAAAWSLLVKTSSIIEKNTDYIFILISLSDKENNNYSLSESIYDFNIWENNLVINNEIKEDKTPINNLLLEDTKIEPVKTEINLWNGSGSQWNIEKIAITANETPNSWPETWILIFLTLIINSIYFLTRKFSH